MADSVSRLPEIDFVQVGAVILPPGATYGPYTTGYWEFGAPLSLPMWMEADGVGGELAPGSVHLAPVGVRKFCRWHPNETSLYGFWAFTTNHPSVASSWRPSTSDDVVLPLLRHVLRLNTDRPSGWEDAVRASLKSALWSFVTGNSSTNLAGTPQFPDPILGSLSYVRVRWKDGRLPALALADLARAGGVTPEYLCRLYDRHVGVSPVAAFRMLRIAHATMLLTQTGLAVGEIARRTGFDNEFHFSRTFKSHTGRTPSGFRSGTGSVWGLPPALKQLSGYLWSQ